MTKSYLLAFITVLSAFIGTASAQFGEPKTKAKFIPEYTSVAPGQSVDIAMKLTHDAHWHSYFINSGQEFTIVPTLDWNSPEGLQSEALKFPTPHEFTFSGTTIYGYEGSNYFLSTVKIPATLKAGETLTLNGSAGWQVCDDKSCLAPNGEDFTLTLSIADQSVANPAYQEVTDYGVKLTPQRALPEGWTISAVESEKGIQLSVNQKLPEGSEFFEYDGQINVQSPRTMTHDSGQTVFLGERRPDSEKQENLRGIVYLSSPLEGSKFQSFWVDIPFGAKQILSTGQEEITPAKAEGAQKAELGVAVTLASLLFGGLILNLMPCVFPVIGLKIMGFVQQAGEDTKKIKLHGLAFTAGVLLSFLALAAALYPLKATTSLGAQLQEPWVVFALLVVMLLLALSMAGLFEIGASATSIGGNLTQKDGLSGSFFSGVLAVVVATPCSAPFLGKAIGVAWQYDGPLFFISLLMMGIGLSLPYITLSFFPALVNKLPRPGAWMESFKQGMSFLLFATVGYLVWVYNAQVGEVGQKGLAIMLGITTIAAAGWVYGRWSLPFKPAKTRVKANIIALALLGSGIALAMPPIEKEVDPEVVAAENAVPELEWEKWSQAKVDQLLAEGKSVYIDYTAKWCLTCQTNKAAAYTADVRKFMHDNNIVVLKADMTKKHTEAAKAIQALDRAAIPVNVLYANGDKTPHITREVLTADYMLEFMQQRVQK